MRCASLSSCVFLSLFNHMTLKGRFKKLHLHTGDEILHSILREYVPSSEIVGVGNLKCI